VAGTSKIFAADTLANFGTNVVTVVWGSPGSDSKYAPRVGYSVDPSSGNVTQIGVWRDGWWIQDLSPAVSVAAVLAVYPTAQRVDREAFSYGWVPAT